MIDLSKYSVSCLVAFLLVLFASASDVYASGDACVDLEVLGTYNGSGVVAVDVAVVGDTAYLADGAAGIRILDVGDPAAPVLLGSYLGSGSFYGVTVAGDIVYANSANQSFPGGTLHIFDASDPASPSPLHLFPSPDGGAGAVAVSGDTACMIDSSANGVFVFDVSDPAVFDFVGSYDTAGQNLIGVCVEGDRAYVIDQFTGLHIVDVSNPASPSLLGSYNAPGQEAELAVVGDRAYVANGFSGLHILDVSDPSSVVLLGTSDSHSASRVAVEGSTAYVIDDGFFGDLLVIDVSDAASPVVMGSYDSPGFALDIAVSGDTAYFTDGSSGLQIIGVSGCNTCAADLTGDGSLNFLDVSAFLSAFGSQDPIADFESDGSFNFLDVSAFLAAFGAGCP
ncbi:MAG: GC-type dockerin domain-anchored protein [Phycisphaerales bacterium]